MNKKENILIAVTGKGSSGKTEFCRGLMKHLPDSRIFFLDGYYHDIKKRRKKGLTGAHPESLEKDALLRDLKKIKDGLYFKKLTSDVSLEDNKKDYVPGKYNLIDGLSALLVPDIGVYDLIIFIECGDKIQLNRRFNRDVKLRNRPKKEIMPVFKKREGQFNEFVLPKKKFSDIILDSDENYKLTYVKTPDIKQYPE
ncbi:MAG: hypothetical protein R6U32_03190 [Candidatus Woesearchaeota archaeon]